MRKLIRIMIFERNYFYFFKKVFDRLAYNLIFKNYYKSQFKYYGDGVTWGRNGEWLLIPKSVRISCPNKIYIGDGCTFDENVYLQAHHESEGLFINKGTRINANSHIQSYSRIIIGENCLIAPFCHINSGNHGYRDKDEPIMFQKYQKGGEIVIGKGVWMGRCSTILGGVSLGSNCVVGDSAVVTKSFENNSIVVGVPAKKI